MNCALDTLVGLVPSWMRSDVDKHGRLNLQEIRMRINEPVELITFQNPSRQRTPKSPSVQVGCSWIAIALL